MSIPFEDPVDCSEIVMFEADDIAGLVLSKLI